jgi:hypothetical protein
MRNRRLERTLLLLGGSALLLILAAGFTNEQGQATARAAVEAFDALAQIRDPGAGMPPFAQQPSDMPVATRSFMDMLGAQR